jgi:hypothetical protein
MRRAAVAVFIGGLAFWPVASRSKQYAGNRTVKVGGIFLNIDADWVASSVARG